MKKEQFSDMMNNIDDELIVNAKETRKKARKVSWKPIGAIHRAFLQKLPVKVRFAYATSISFLQ